jgi:GT2 family glycosyltransferase
MVSNPKVFVSILNWNQAERTISCIHSLQNLRYNNLKIVVVDNASVDDSVNKIRQACPDIHLIRSTENLGYPGGNELALKVALEDYSIDLFWLLNNDTVVLSDTLNCLVQAYQEHGSALYGGIPVRVSDNGYLLHMRVWENRTFRMLRAVPIDDYYDTLVPRFVEALSGSHLMVPLSIVRKHGFMDTSFFLYSEDTDYCFRLRQQGVNLIEVPQSMVIHTGGASHKKTIQVRDLKPIIHYYRVRNRIILYRRHLGFRKTLIEVLRQCFYSIAWLLIIRHGTMGYHMSYYAVLGIRDGIRKRMGKTFAPESVLHNIKEV